VLLSGQGNNLLELYYKTSHNGYQYSSLVLNKNVTWLSFADLDGNGATDMFLVIFENNEYVPYILTNSNSPGELCETFGRTSYELGNMRTVALPENYKLVEDSNIKIGDYDFDGFPDLMGIFAVDGYRKVSILGNNDLSFGVLDANMEPLNQVNNPIQACPYDFNEEGKISILVISQATKANGSTGLPRSSIINNLIEDTLFIKILPLLPSSSSDFQSTALVGGIGVTIQWRLTNLNGDKTISVVNQKIQWNFGTLQLPFATHGLGRTNNYIEDLTVGYPGYGVKNSWTPVIPNSQLVLVPQTGDDWVL
jgi:hypothetical protein